MRLDLSTQIEVNPTLPLDPVECFTGSAVLLHLDGIRPMIGGGDVTAVAVTITNADGMPATGDAERLDDGTWRILFSAANFTHYGWVKWGVRVVATVTRAGVANTIILGIGNFRVVQGSAQAQPGTPEGAYVVKGDDVYFKSYELNGVQHYVKQVMEYDPEIGWGANWTGDYILADAEFIPYTAPEAEG